MNTAGHYYFTGKKMGSVWEEVKRKEVQYPCGAVWQAAPNGDIFPFSGSCVNSN